MRKPIPLWLVSPVLYVCATLIVPSARAAAPATPPPATAPVTAPSAASAVSVEAPEDWKGKSDSSVVQLGGLTGLGFLGNSASFVLLGTAAVKIVRHGFIPDINNSVWLETQIGPLVTQGSVAFDYSLHMRWDFQKDDTWTFFALGGVAGDITGDALGGQFLIFPSFGVGALYRVSDLVLVRGQISHEQIVAGVTIPFYL